MNSGFHELLELSKIDRQLVGLKKILDAFPADVDRQQLRCDAAAAELAENENSAQTLENQIRRENLEIDACKAEISELSTKINIVKNKKEYEIITERIKDMKDNIATHEETVLTAMESLEALKPALAERRNDLEAEQRALENLNAEIVTKTQEIKTRQKALVGERKQQIARVEAAGRDFMPVYNAALQRGKGIAFAVLSGGVCAECHRKATANLVSQVQARSNIEKCLCDGCGRILYLED